MELEKTIHVRFYDFAGVYIGNIVDVTIGSFRKVINGGLGDMTMELAMGFAEAYESQYTVLFNRVEVVVTDAETPPAGVVVYSGFILERYPTIKGNEQKVILTCRGHAARFPYLPLRASTTTAISTNTSNGLVTGTSASYAGLDEILGNIVYIYNQTAIHPIIDATASSIVNSTRTLTYTFKTKSIQFAIEKVMENAEPGAYWRVGADNIFYFRQRSTEPDHILTLGSQITSLEDRQTMDGMINRLHFAYNGSPATVAKLFSDSDSSDRYGDWWDFKVDGRYTVDSEAANVGTSIIASKKLPPRRTIITVADSNGDRLTGYDIERFEPGDTVSILDLPQSAQQNFPSMFQIAAVQYEESLKSATLELDTLDDDLAREVAKSEKQQQAESTEDGPTSYS